MAEIYRTDLPNVMHETIDGEVVVANLDSGIYYGIDGIGGRIWELFGDKGRTIEAVVDTIAGRYQGDRAQITTAVERFVGVLRDEALVRVVTDDPSGGEPAARADGEPTETFVEPEISKYTDMEALLLADPIHEVDDTGWPNLK